MFIFFVHPPSIFCFFVLQNNIVGCKGFISTPLEIAGSALANVFHEVKVNLVSAEAERICIDRMVKGQDEPFDSPEGLAEVDSRMASLVSSFSCPIHVQRTRSTFYTRTSYFNVFVFLSCWFFNCYRVVVPPVFQAITMADGGRQQDG